MLTSYNYAELFSEDSSFSFIDWLSHNVQCPLSTRKHHIHSIVRKGKGDNAKMQRISPGTNKMQIEFLFVFYLLLHVCLCYIQE